MNSHHLLSLIVSVLVSLSFTACGKQKERSAPEIVENNTATAESLAFVERYYAARAAGKYASRNDIPLLISMRVGPATDPDVCTTGKLYGPFTVTDNLVEGSPTVQADQPTLSLANNGELAICTIITSPVNATLDFSLDSVHIDTEECTEPAASIGGIWRGDYSCSSACGDESGNITLVLLQDDHSASYTDDEASYEGSVCGNQFKFSGGSSTYEESGTFTLNSNGTASKTSQYQQIGGSCSGQCSDPLLQLISTTILDDDFDDGSRDGVWVASAVNTQNDVNSWTFSESESLLQVTDLAPETIYSQSGQSPWSQLILEHQMNALDDFIVEFTINWQADDNNAMQYLYVQMFEPGNGPRIAYAGFSDAWVGSSGQQISVIGSDVFSSGIGTLTNTGSASVKIVRISGNTRVLWNGSEIHQGMTTGNLGRVSLNFGHYPYDNNTGAASSFGTLSIDQIRITGIAN